MSRKHGEKINGKRKRETGIYMGKEKRETETEKESRKQTWKKQYLGRKEKLEKIVLVLRETFVALECREGPQKSFLIFFTLKKCGKESIHVSGE